MKQGIQECHRKCAANNIVVVCRIHLIKTLKQELNGTEAYDETSTEVKAVVNSHLNSLPIKLLKLLKNAKQTFYDVSVTKAVQKTV